MSRFVGRSKERVLHPDHPSVHLVQKLLSLVLETDPSVVEGIDEEVLRRAPISDEEVPREVHALEG